MRYERDNGRGKNTNAREGKRRGTREQVGNIFRVGAGGGGGNHRRVGVIKGESNQERGVRAFTILEIARETSKRGHDHRRGVVT